MSKLHIALSVWFLGSIGSAVAVGDSYDDALARAKQEGKYFVVVVYDGECPDCKRLDETLKDAEVQDWFSRRGVLLRLSGAEPTGKNFITAHHIIRFPTVMLMTSEPRELGRKFGHLEPKAFLDALEGFAQGLKVRGPAGLQPWGGHDVVMSTIDRANKLTDEGEFDKAFQELTWCFEHTAARSPVFAAQGLPKLLGALAKLGEKHPPAKEAFRTYLAAAERETLRTPHPSTYSLYTVKHAHLVMNDEAGLVAHYDRMKRGYPNGTGPGDFARLIYGPLLHARRYEDIRYSVSDPNETMIFFDEARRTGMDKNEIRSLMADRYEVLLGLGMDDEAALLSERLLRVDKSKKTHIALSEAALRSGRPTDADITYARKVYMASEGGDVHPVIVLAKLLAIKTPKSSEAIQLVRSGLTLAKSTQDRAALNECLREINSGKVAAPPPADIPQP